RSGLRADILGIDADQPRHADRIGRALVLFDTLLNAPVGDRHPRARTHVLRPRRHDETLDEAAVLGQVAEDPPIADAIAAAYRFGRVERAQEIIDVLVIDQVFDLD